jgi:hypothetical protein
LLYLVAGVIISKYVFWISTLLSRRRHNVKTK